MDYIGFARDWEAGWNSHDLSRIMAHYREDILFRSLKAVDLAGTGDIRGRVALRAYWAAALERQPDLEFRVCDVFEGFEMLVLSYLNHHGVLACETLYFDQDEMVFQAAACHRVVQK